MAFKIGSDTKRAQRRLITRAKIIAAATAIFDADGYEAMTMRRLAAQIGMTTGAVFGHFTGKDQIYREIYGHDPVTPEQGRALLAEVAALKRAA